ncbi:hypothetical protein [Bizionia gelidisalsuginis]|nr:hypothetical protein [Bizionia gelidisalsuginis]
MHIPSGEVHKGRKGETTACGINTKEQLDHWGTVKNTVTCNKKGCKN